MRMKKDAVSSILVALVLLALGLIAEAQQPRKSRVRYLNVSSPSTRPASRIPVYITIK
jgi:hypothetical protein